MRSRPRSRLGIDRLGGWAMRAKLFRNGRSQAVRLPAEFRSVSYTHLTLPTILLV